MNTQAYLRRIGAQRPATTDLKSLGELQRAHLESVPFENLGPFLGERVDLGAEALYEKIVARRRGGQCYELNGAFALLLRELGFTVELLGGRVLARTGRLGPPLDHLAIRVELEQSWLVDVGFGRFSIRPLRLADREPQDDPGGSFLLRDAPGGDVEVLRAGVLLYRLERRPRDLEEFRGMAWWHTTSPDSTFTHGPTCSLATPGGRVTLAGRRLIETTGADRVERELPGDAAVLAAYRRYFGIELDRVPEPSLSAFPAPPHERTS